MRAVPFPVFSIYDSTLHVKQSEKAAFAFTPTFFRERLSLSNDMHWLATFPLAEVDLRIPGSENRSEGSATPKKTKSMLKMDLHRLDLYAMI